MRINKRTILTLLFILSVTGLFYLSCGHPGQIQDPQPESEIEDTVLAQVNAFYHFIKDTFQPAVVLRKAGSRRLQRIFLRTRMLYKKFEWAGEYFLGTTSLRVNGPPVQEVENADLLNAAYAWARNPAGLQVIATYLFPQYDTTKREKLIDQLHLLQSNCRLYSAFFGHHPLSDWRILDAVKLEVFRILTLGITGYDAPLTLNSSIMDNCATSLNSLKGVLEHYTRKVRGRHLITLINAAIAYLYKNSDFDSFNRAEFITHYGNKISASIEEIQHKLNLSKIKYNRLLNQEAKTLFDTDAFNVNAFAPGPGYFITEQKVKLGERLFHDVHLSGPGTRSCASCHQPDRAFTDGLAKNTAVNGKKKLPRNTPTLINAALQSNLFYDMRALTLEAQADTVFNSDEMEGSLPRIIQYISHNKLYKKLFMQAYPASKMKGIDSAEVLNAIASYVRSLTKLNSRFDRYMQGDSTALTRKEIKGFNLFMGKAQCGTCHFLPLFSGITPPKFVQSEAEIIGVPESLRDSIIDPDPGWYNIVKIPSYKYAFKTPTLRNAARTAPYMHNGIYTTLKQVLTFYNHGGGAGMGLKIANQTLSTDSLHLTQKEIGDIIAFIKSLNSR